MIILSQTLGEIIGSTQNIVIDIIVDTPADLPAQNALSPYTIVSPSTARCVSGGRYMMNSSGSWILQPGDVTLNLTGYYTSAETDAAIGAALSNYYTSAEVNAAISENNIGTAGTANEDLNSFTEIGHRYWSASNAGTLANRPLGTQSGAFSAQNFPIGIDPQNPRVLQMGIYNVVSGMAQNRIFLRILSSSGWSGWFENTMTPLV